MTLLNLLITTVGRSASTKLPVYWNEHELKCFTCASSVRSM